MKKIKPIILGISCFYHDSAAALIQGENIIAACQEERFSRIKFDSNFPEMSINYCLSEANIDISEIDLIVFYEDPEIKLDRIIKIQSIYSPFKFISNLKKVHKWIKNKSSINQFIKNKYKNFKGEIFYSNHHLSHAASCFYPSNFKESIILIFDGVGEWASSSIGVGDHNKINIIKEQRFPHSLGMLYSSFTQYCGFKVLSGEYKLMGLAPYGKPTYYKKIINNLINLNDDGSFTLNLKYFNFLTGDKMINKNFCDLFGSNQRLPEEKITQKYMDIASSIQKVTEEIIYKTIVYAKKITGKKNLVMAGGVALNCVANGKILSNKLVEKIWIQPAPGDAGGSIGAAFIGLYYHYNFKKENYSKKDIMKNSLLGKKYSNDEILEYLQAFKFNYKFIKKEIRSNIIAQKIDEGKIIGLFQDRMEFGPRALGSRSIIADARDRDMQRKLNLKIKFREDFRPFAPMVMEEHASKWFDLFIPSPYMLFTAGVNKDKILQEIRPNKENFEVIDNLNLLRSKIQAVTHVDYSARIQTINKIENPILYDILDAFNQITGCPVIINTSFNIRGEPIVNTPVDALKCFMNTDIDVLILENFILEKKNQPDSLIDRDYKKMIQND